MQETSYPDPKQLRAYARGPAPFHELDFDTCEIGDDGTVTFRVRDSESDVEYVFEPTYIKVEVAPDEYEYVEEVDDVDMDHREAWDRALDTEIGEDFLCATDFTQHQGETAKYDAYWILDSVIINRKD